MSPFRGVHLLRGELFFSQIIASPSLPGALKASVDSQAYPSLIFRGL